MIVEGVPLPVLAVDKCCRGWRQLLYVRVGHVAMSSCCSGRRVAGGLASGMSGLCGLCLSHAGFGIRWKYVFGPILAPVGAMGASSACDRDPAT